MKKLAIILFFIVPFLGGCSSSNVNTKEQDKKTTIINTLSTTTEVNNATTTKARDEKRLSDIGDLRTILGLYFNNWHRFPVAKYEINVGGNTLCMEQEGFIKAATSTGQAPGMNHGPNIYLSTTCKGTSYINLTSSNPSVGTNGVCPDKDYTYLSKDGLNYSLRFCLEEGAENFEAGNHEATKNGIK